MKYFFSILFFIHFLSLAYDDPYKEYTIPEYYLPKNSLVTVVGNDITFFSSINYQKQTINGNILIKSDLEKNQIKIDYNQDLLSKIPVINHCCALLGLLNIRLKIKIPDESIIEFKVPEGVKYIVQTRED